MRRRSWFAMFVTVVSLFTGDRALAATLELSAPNAVYPGTNNEYRLTLQGSAAAAVSPIFADRTPTAIRIGNNNPMPLAACPTTAPTTLDPWACFVDKDATHRTIVIELHNVTPGKVSSVISFEHDVSNQLTMVLAWIGPTATRFAAAAATIVGVAIVLIIISLGANAKLANGNDASPLKAMIIDKATSTYSLSKVQLYIWLFSAASAYLYLLAAKALAQSEFMLVDVPQSIVTVALISIGTTVVSTGTSSLAGGKGSGQFDPTPSDLITSGGDVAPERVQQLLWTLIAAPAFVVFAYMADPATLQGIQGVPDHFLQLMGVSAAGYVGGKIARGAGPKITNLTASLVAGPPPFLILSIQGSDIQTRGIAFTLSDKATTPPTTIPFPANIQPTSVIDGSGIATTLDLQAPAAGLRRPAPGIKYGYVFAILTTDGERAEWEF